MKDLNDMGVSAKKAARILSTSSSELRNKALITISKHLLNSEDKILEKNYKMEKMFWFQQLQVLLDQ